MSYRGNCKGSYGIKRLQRVHARRSSRAKKIDEALKAPIAKTPEQWLAQPNRFDIPEVDTPKKSENKQEETASPAFEPSRISHREFMERLSRHKHSGETH